MWQADDPRSRGTKAEVLRSAAGAKLDGAGEGNRTLVCSLGSWRRFKRDKLAARGKADIRQGEWHVRFGPNLTSRVNGDAERVLPAAPIASNRHPQSISAMTEPL